MLIVKRVFSFAEQPPAQQNQASTPKQQNSRLDSVANSLGSQKSFVSEEEWRFMDKKVRMNAELEGKTANWPQQQHAACMVHSYCARRTCMGHGQQSVPLGSDADCKRQPILNIYKSWDTVDSLCYLMVG
jgi:hypothetical protein